MSVMGLRRIAKELMHDVEDLQFKAPVTHVYNPLVYAWKSHARYLERFGRGRRDTLLVGMNPGPFGMAQTGVPFGEVAFVRDWLGIEEAVGKPAREHPKRPIQGFACPRSEVSGRRLWDWARQRFGTPERFFARFFVHNYCPLAFLEASGRNRTPDKLPARERAALFSACDRALLRVCRALTPRLVIGIGIFAEKRARAVLGERDITIARMPHPSPASPLANRGWAEAADRALRNLSRGKNHHFGS